MANHSPHPKSLSPRVQSAFEWPVPVTVLNPMNNQTNELSVKEILDRYNADAELLKYILTAKSEEDKKKAAKDTLKAEEARIQLRQMDLDFAREQTKASTRYERHRHPPPPHQAPPPQSRPQPQPPVPTTTIQSHHLQHHPHPHHHPPHAYYGLAPVQQQVLARFNYHYPPASPSVPYPHSAHPLCPPTSTNNKASSFNNNNNNNNNTRIQQPTSPNDESKKRNHSSISSLPNNNEQQQQLTHNKVMEALKAKIQRGNGGPPSPLTASPIQLDNNKKRKPTLPRPVVIHETINSITPSSPSPRSAKPILPPIDTNLGRIDNSTIINSDVSSDHGGNDDSGSGAGSAGSAGSDETKIVLVAVENSTTTTTTTSTSPSDHILLNTRRARSLSPSSL